MGHPVYQFLQKPDFSDFTVSGSGLPLGHRYLKYMSLCWSNSYFMASAVLGGAVYIISCILQNIEVMNKMDIDINGTM